jgi:hypothetical protein
MLGLALSLKVGTPEIIAVVSIANARGKFYEDEATLHACLLNSNKRWVEF